MSVEDRVDGLPETSEAIASECDVTFELYSICYPCLYAHCVCAACINQSLLANSWVTFDTVSLGIYRTWWQEWDGWYNTFKTPRTFQF